LVKENNKNNNCRSVHYDRLRKRIKNLKNCDKLKNFLKINSRIPVIGRGERKGKKLKIVIG
jgi:hypothetical protein